MLNVANGLIIHRVATYRMPISKFMRRTKLILQTVVTSLLKRNLSSLRTCPYAKKMAEYIIVTSIHSGFLRNQLMASIESAYWGPIDGQAQDLQDFTYIDLTCYLGTAI